MEGAGRVTRAFECVRRFITQIVSTASEQWECRRGEGLNLPSVRFICTGNMQRVSRGFHAVTKAPVRPAYLPCSKTREGVYPAVKSREGAQWH